MNFCNKVIIILFLGVVKSIVATLATNVTTNSTVFEEDVPFSLNDISDQMNAVTLAHIVHESSDHLGDVEATLRVAEAALSTSRRYNDQQTDNSECKNEGGVDSDINIINDVLFIEDVTDTNEESGNDNEHHTAAETLIDLTDNAVNEDMISINDEQASIQENSDSTEQKDKRVIEDVLLGMRALPDNATFWELFKAQVCADFAPILIIIPRPIKKLIASNAVKLGRKLKLIFGGPIIPMISVAGKVIGIIGNGVIYVGEDIVKLADFLVSVGNKPLLESQQQINSSALQIFESEDERSRSTDPPRGGTDDNESVDTIDVLNSTLTVQSNQIEDEVIIKDVNEIEIHEYDNVEIIEVVDDPLADEIIELELTSSSEQHSDLISEGEVKENTIEVYDTKSTDLSLESDQMCSDDIDTAAVDSIIDINLSDIDNNYDTQEESEVNVETDYIEL